METCRILEVFLPFLGIFRSISFWGPIVMAIFQKWQKIWITWAKIWVLWTNFQIILKLKKFWFLHKFLALWPFTSKNFQKKIILQLQISYLVLKITISKICSISKRTYFWNMNIQIHSLTNHQNSTRWPGLH